MFGYSVVKLVPKSNTRTFTESLVISDGENFTTISPFPLFVIVKGSATESLQLRYAERESGWMEMTGAFYTLNTLLKVSELTQFEVINVTVFEPGDEYVCNGF